MMKLNLKKADLVKGMNIVSKAVSVRTTMPILECIFIDATTDILKLTANNMELGIETFISGDIIENGKTAVNASIFFEIIRKLPEQDVSIEVDSNDQMIIICGKAKFSIGTKDSTEFPNLPKIKKNNFLTLSQFILKDMIKKTIFSIATHDGNKLMTGELFEVKDNHLRVASLDGHRISVSNVELKENHESFKVVIPGRTLQEISKIIEDDPEQFVEIYSDSNHIIFELDQTIIVSRLIDGEYFNIDQMLSVDYDTKVILNKKELLECIDRATLLVKESDKKPIVMKIENELMDLNLKSEIGSMNEQITITKEGKDLLIAFNPKFFLDALKVIEDEEIELYMMNPKAPCFIKDKKESYIYLILPVNFNA